MGAFTLDNLKPGVVNNFAGSKPMGAINPKGIISNVELPARQSSGRPIAPVVTGDPVLEKAGPAMAAGILETARTGGGNRVQTRDRRGNPTGRTKALSIRNGGMSAADWYRPGAPGSMAQAEMEGKTPEEQAAIAQAARATEETRSTQGIAASEFYRDRRPLADRVKATGIDGLKSGAERDASIRSNWASKGVVLPEGGSPEIATSIRRTVASPEYQTKLAARDAQETKSREADMIRTAQSAGIGTGAGNTVAVEPRYAGPGQATTDLTRDQSGRLVNVTKPGVRETPQVAAIGGLPTTFKQGSGRVVDMSSALSNPQGKPLASLADASFLGGGNNVPSLYDNPAVAQADKTVNGVNRSDLMNAFKEADAKQKSGPSAPPVTVAKKPASEEEDRKKFAAPIKLSLS